MKRFGRIPRIVGIVLVLFALYMWSGTSAGETRIEYTVDARDPANGIVHVTMRIQPPARPFLTLWLRDVNHRGLSRVESFSARRDSRSVLNWQTLPAYADARSIWTGFSRKPVEVSYDVNPYWAKGQSPRSYLGPDFGYLRGMVVLYTPFTPKSISGMLNNVNVLEDAAGQARLQFLLPEAWTLISPWGHDQLTAPIAHIRNTYFGLGHMSTSTAQVGDNVFLLGVYTGLDEEQRERILRDVPPLFETMGQLTGISPENTTPYWALTILPYDPIHGGASGTSSLITTDSLSTISHEMFHWWNGGTIKSASDADWIREGFTEYYEGKALYAAGIWSAEELDEHLDKLYERKGMEFVQMDGQWAPIHLARASQNLRRKHTQEDYNKVYNGGALIAYFLDQELQKQGKSLDDIWRVLNEAEEQITTDLFLQELEKLGGAPLANACEEMVYGRRAIPRP